MTLAQLHARNSFDATSAALIKAVESDTFKNKGEYEAVTEVKFFLWLIYISGDRLGQSQTRIQNRMVTLYYTENVHIAQTRTPISIPHFRMGQESESVPESLSGNVNDLFLYESFELFE